MCLETSSPITPKVKRWYIKKVYIFFLLLKVQYSSFSLFRTFHLFKMNISKSCNVYSGIIAKCSKIRENKCTKNEIILRVKLHFFSQFWVEHHNDHHTNTLCSPTHFHSSIFASITIFGFLQPVFMYLYGSAIIFKNWILFSCRMKNNGFVGWRSIQLQFP